jgi:hypothetical protein
VTNTLTDNKEQQEEKIVFNTIKYQYSCSTNDFFQLLLINIDLESVNIHPKDKIAYLHNYLLSYFMRMLYKPIILHTSKFN